MLSHEEAMAWVPDDHKRTFWGLLEMLKTADEFMSEEVDFSELLDLTGEKVDAIKYVDERLEAQELLLKRREEELAQMRKGVAANRERLKKRALEAMQFHGFEKLPGKQYRAQIQKSPPALVLVRESATVDDVLEYPKFVKTVYEWDKIAIRDELAKGPSPFPLAYTQCGEYVRFYPTK